MQDRIERVVLLPVGIERVWRAITDPDELACWFGTRAEIDLRPGGEALFEFGEISGRSTIVTVDPPRRFSFKGHPTGDVDPSLPVDEIPTTLTEFLLEETASGTRLTLIESGFATLPEAMREQALKGNEQGWGHELSELLAYLSNA